VFREGSGCEVSQCAQAKETPWAFETAVRSTERAAGKAGGVIS
jgi:hypothetical protein